MSKLTPQSKVGGASASPPKLLVEKGKVLVWRRLMRNERHSFGCEVIDRVRGLAVGIYILHLMDLVLSHIFIHLT